jgi:8-oxo-dGTP pyrophosphatase MutT (NUDIX family)
MKKIVCSGALFYTLDTNRFLLLHRCKSRQSYVWGLVGGTNEDLETPWEGLTREIEEEIGFLPDIKKTIPLETFVSNDEHFNFHTYLCVVSNEFIPKLNGEHDGYSWVSFGKWPKPLHQGLNNTLRSKINQQKLQTVFELIKLIS